MKFYSIKSQDIFFNQVKYDLRHTYESPYERNDLYLKLLNEQNVGNPTNFLEPELGYSLYADVDFEYNYYSPMFEQFTIACAMQNTHWKLPSLNVWLLGTKGLADSELEYRMFQSVDSSGNEMDPSSILSKDYFESRERTINFYITEAFLRFYTTKTAGFDKPEFINKEVTKLYYDKENKREMFPMFAKLKLTGIQKSAFCALTAEYQLEDKFIDFLVYSRIEDNRSNNPVNFQINNGEEVSAVSSYVYLYDYNQFIQFVENGEEGYVYNHNNQNLTTCEYFESFLRMQVYKQKMLETIRTMKKGDLFPVAFRLEKYSNETDLVSTHYFFNYEDIETFTYFDTQITYSGKYRYKLKVINALKIEEDSLKFIEEPYYEESILVLDSPPIAPDIDIVTYRGIDNKVLIMFNQMIDKKALVPILVNPSDSSSFAMQYDSQKIPTGKPLIFESDDPVDFEFFRLSKKPEKYTDFSNENYKTIVSRGATAAAYEDTIVPNQTYYYMFRAQDRHGFVSNPTPIYEFVLIKQGETLYPKIRIVDLALPEPPVQKTKSFKKYVKIGFSPRQYQIPKDEIAKIDDSLIGDNIDIGISKDNIIGSDRVFKFRIKSKNTGKLIDINVTVKKNKVIKG